MRADTIQTDATLAQLAATHPGASRVFHRHGLDFCCHGDVSLESACQGAGLGVDELLDELRSEEPLDPSFEDWNSAVPNALIEHILERYHKFHRAEVPRLLEMARKVEQAHGEKASCPKGLVQHLAHMQRELELHMRKEEEILFPAILAGNGAMMGMPVQAMEHEHREHGANLARLRELAQDFQAPEEACGTWKALYLELEQLESDLMHHIHLENNILFPKILRG